MGNTMPCNITIAVKSSLKMFVKKAVADLKRESYALVLEK